MRTHKKTKYFNNDTIHLQLSIAFQKLVVLNVDQGLLDYSIMIIKSKMSVFVNKHRHISYINYPSLRFGFVNEF